MLQTIAHTGRRRFGRRRMARRHWIKWTALAAGVIAGSAAFAVAGATVAWQQATERVVARLTPGTAAAAHATFAPDQLAGLPEPVARYFRHVLTPDLASTESWTLTGHRCCTARL